MEVDGNYPDSTESSRKLTEGLSGAMNVDKMSPSTSVYIHCARMIFHQIPLTFRADKGPFINFRQLSLPTGDLP